MVTEDYVSFEIAKLLVQKGLLYNDAEYESYYTFKGEVVYLKDKPRELNVAPRLTIQMALKWLREVHNISVRPRYEEMEDEKERLWYVWFFDILSMKPYKTLVEIEQGYSTYEEAVEAAIKYTLENLL